MPAVTADGSIERTDKPLHITKRIGSTTYKVSVHFSRTSRETMGDKLVRLIERDTVKQ
ncbi:transposon-encoded TnpW family protein [uncultured Oscillibacter sp.]|uniref:transposon-encoded TnpW family protein n=1 Tax=uncultured Oscillibacter sp. TaxID=876091 RepID=UPI0025EB3016|nr:transposon-encoded TnpW family protein [uncultured Oscillibacter sp.]